MEKKPKPFVSKAQMAHAYKAYKDGKVSYPDLMKSVHATGDASKLPDRITEKKATAKKVNLAIKGLI